MEKLNCVLLIDDDSATNFLNKRLILKIGAAEHVRITKNGREGLDYILKAFDSEDENYPQPEIVFLDLNMPLINGWEFLEEYSQLPKSYRQSIIVVMLTTSLRPMDKERAENTNEVFTYIQKPLTAEELQKVLTEYWEYKKQSK